MKGVAGIVAPADGPFREAAQRSLSLTTFRWKYAPLRRKA